LKVPFYSYFSQKLILYHSSNNGYEMLIEEEMVLTKKTE